jgi:Zn-dependent peptidase ImmA (M78 family)/transcriptional regulator with XRE-family HTH domain
MESEAVSERVRSLIDSMGATQDSFAALVGLDSTKLSKSLNGKRRFTSLELAQVAQAGNVTVDWLLTGQVEALAARVSPQSTGDLAPVIDEARRIAEARENLAFLGVRPELPPTPAVTSSLWIDQGNELAEFALQNLGLPNVSADTEDFASAIERVFAIDVRFTDTHGVCDGLALHATGARVLIVATSQKPTRHRFTMAHELCHLLCGDDQEELHVDRDIMASASKKGPSEVRANVFAASLLMPESILAERTPRKPTDDLWFHELVMDLMVSPSALSWRLFNLKLLTHEDRARLGGRSTVESAAALDKLKTYTMWLEGSESSRVPTALIEDVLQAYLDRKTTLQPLATLLQADIQKVRAAIEDASAEEEEQDAFVP